MSNNTPITGRATIGDWLAHPVGGPLLRELLVQAGRERVPSRPRAASRWSS